MKKRRNGWKWITIKRRMSIYKRDNCECIICGASRYDYGVTLTLDHVNSDLVNGKRNNKTENLITMCKSCNSTKQELTMKEFLTRYHPNKVAPLLKKIE